MSSEHFLKQAAKKAFRRYGYEVRKTPGLVDFLRSRDIDTVLDVGANIGQFARSLRDEGYTGRIVSFEPIASVYRTLVENARGDARWECRNYALGAEKGAATIHVSRYSVFSSILPQTALAMDFDKSAEVASDETIVVAALDDFFDDDFGSAAVFLKIDTQGFEPSVLQGAARSLPRILGVQLEVPVVHLYEGTWTMESALAEMRRQGFVVAQVRPVNVLSDDPHSIVEIDCVFRRMTPSSTPS